MKTILIGAMMVCLASGTALARDTAPAPMKRNNVCLWTYMVDHTHTVDPSTVLFYMRGGKVWKNKLLTPCPGLMFHGFAFITRDGTICSNQQAIFVLKSHEVCMLGAFEPYTEKPGKKPDRH